MHLFGILYSFQPTFTLIDPYAFDVSPTLESSVVLNIKVTTLTFIYYHSSPDNVPSCKQFYSVDYSVFMPTNHKRHNFLDEIP